MHNPIAQRCGHQHDLKMTRFLLEKHNYRLSEVETPDFGPGLEAAYPGQHEVTKAI